MPTSRKGQVLINSLSLLGLANLSFLFGATVMLFHLPAYEYIHDGYVGIQTWWAREKELAQPEPPSFRKYEPVDKPGAYDGYTMTLQAPDQPKINLYDMHGKVVHSWDAQFSRIWGKNPPHVRDLVDDGLIFPFSGHLFPNGDLIVNYHGQTNGVQNGYGMVKLDKDSKVIWKYAANCHHDFDVADDGTIYAVKQEVIRKPMKGLEFLSQPCMVDHLVVLSSEGVEKDVIPILTALRDSPYASLLGKLEVPFVHGVQKPSTVEEDTKRRDVMHTNHVEVLKKERAAKFPMFKAGQIMLSMRHLDMICVMDPTTRKVVWACRGPWLEQHDPEWLDNGHILLFDNRMNEGWSRVLEFDPVTQGFAWSLSGKTDLPFYSFERSNAQRLPNGNTLVSVTHDRVVFEVTPAKEMVWCLPCKADVNFAQRYGPDQIKFLPEDVHPR